MAEGSNHKLLGGIDSVIARVQSVMARLARASRSLSDDFHVPIESRALFRNPVVQHGIQFVARNSVVQHSIRAFASRIFIGWLALCEAVLALEGTELEPYSVGSRAFSGALQTTTNKTRTRGALNDVLRAAFVHDPRYSSYREP